MRAEDEGVQPPLVSQVVQLDDVGVHVVDVVRVRRVLVVCPLVRSLRRIRLDRKSSAEEKKLTATSMSNIAFSGFDSSSTESNPITYCSAMISSILAVSFST